MGKPYYKNVLLIAGTGRDVGKTTMSEKIIRKMAKSNPVTAIKISSHFHKLKESDFIIYNSNDLQIVEEQFTETGKDSARMLKAGARKVYYVQAKDRALPEIFSLIEDIQKDTPVLCESGGLINYILPAVFLLMIRETGKSSTKKQNNYAKFPHVSVDLEQDNSEKFITEIDFVNGGWIYPDLIKKRVRR